MLRTTVQVLLLYVCKWLHGSTSSTNVVVISTISTVLNYEYCKPKNCHAICSIQRLFAYCDCCTTAYSLLTQALYRPFANANTPLNRGLVLQGNSGTWNGAPTWNGARIVPSSLVPPPPAGSSAPVGGRTALLVDEVSTCTFLLISYQHTDIG
jgi:hypothetical protein